MSWAWVLR